MNPRTSQAALQRIGSTSDWIGRSVRSRGAPTVSSGAAGTGASAAPSTARCSRPLYGGTESDSLASVQATARVPSASSSGVMPLAGRTGLPRLDDLRLGRPRVSDAACSPVSTPGQVSSARPSAPSATRRRG